MQTPKKTDLMILALALMAAAQLRILTSQQRLLAAKPVHWLEVGDTIPDFRALDHLGNPSCLLSGDTTVLLVFRSDCGHCRSVAPTWRDWIAGPGEGIRVVAVTSEPLEQASGFVSDQLLGVDLLAVLDVEPSSPAHALTARTPWVFLLDEAGTIIAHGGGNEIGALGEVLERSISDSSDE